MDSFDLQQELDNMGLLVRELEASAARTPDKTFIFYGEENRILTYGDFNRQANNLAGHLRDTGVEKGDRVSLFLHHPITTILSMFGLWKIGAVFCPINFLYQGRLLSYQINDTRPKLLITEQSRVPLLNQIRGDLPALPIWLHVPDKGDHDYREEVAVNKLVAGGPVRRLEELLEGDRVNPEVPLDYWDLANIIYTSGTTGPPKGVVQSHRWLQNYCYYGVKLLQPEDVVYCDLPLYHVGGAFPWSGGRLGGGAP